MYEPLDPAMPDARPLWAFLLWVNAFILFRPISAGFEEGERHCDWGRLVVLVRLTLTVSHPQSGGKVGKTGAASAKDRKAS